uniref:cytochrome b n=1 Tax=Nisia atrovenosa TaxID=1187023 RepID=UPI002A81D473|nr:cytochrome b [Nisia atrovenosa]WOW98929.1 cytochrome b [Nisia atrovenosa]
MNNFMNMKFLNKNMKNLPLPSNINLWWNMGSLLGTCLFIQLITGIFLTFHYNSCTNLAFESIIHISRNVNNGWIIRLIHANGASMFFLIVFLHISRGLFYGSYKLKKTWISGNIILLTLMATAFLGYVLPWGQMSFWGATVITNLLSAIPYLGMDIVNWIWGGFSVDKPTLSRFFSFHFILPFLILLISLIHITLLHEKGSSNPLGINSSQDKISFHPFFSIKDLMSLIFSSFMLLILIFYSPFLLMDPENFIQANSMVTPPHIQPEWYFLFAYAILRSIPNKLGGVIALLMSILIISTLSFSMKSKFQSTINYPINKMILWIIFNSTILLTWIGAQPVSEPYITTSQILTIIYFLQFILLPINTKIWDKFYN